jgi:AcrR family transcriptional regulator
MAAVAERMEVTRPVVYACYAGRGELLSALLERERSWALSNMLAMLPPQRTGSIQQMFVDGFSTLLSSVRERPASWRIIVAADPDPALTADIARCRAQIAERVSTVMRPLMERWQVRDIDRALPVLTEVFLTICETAVRMMLDAQQNWAPDDLADIVGRAAYRALRATT